MGIQAGSGERQTGGAGGTGWTGGRPPDGVALLRGLLAAEILSTAIHYTHNFVEVHRYPGPHGAFDTVTRVLIVITWPLLTGIGLLGYRRYTEGRPQEARVGLAIYSLTGMVTLGHFIFGSPHIPALFYATLFTDTLTGLAVLAFALRLARAPTGPAGRVA
jgi:peptidoglycan/LPS O-acetylase OafA/YrhL